MEKEDMNTESSCTQGQLLISLDGKNFDGDLEEPSWIKSRIRPIFHFWLVSAFRFQIHGKNIQFGSQVTFHQWKSFNWNPEINGGNSASALGKWKVWSSAGFRKFLNFLAFSVLQTSDLNKILKLFSLNDALQLRS